MEDIACSGYLTALLQNANPEPDIYLQHLTTSPTAVCSQTAADPTRQDDLKCAIDLNRFSFALQASSQTKRFTHAKTGYPLTIPPPKTGRIQYKV